MSGSHIVELIESLSASNFEKIGHQTASHPEWFISRMPPLKSDRMPVASNRRCNRSCNPCSLSSVLQFRAIFNASIRVATPELSIWVTPDKSMLTVLGCGACKRAISWSRTAGEESISILLCRRRQCAVLAGDGLHSRFLDTFAVVAQHGVISPPAQCLCSAGV